MTSPPSWHLDLPDEAATLRLGEALAAMLRPGDVVTFAGPLGAGKTTLARHLLRGFAGDDTIEVPSPTFTLVQPYESSAFRFPVWHVDLYRIGSAAELDELGLDDALARGAALLVEWPERASERWPASRIEVALAAAGDSRVASVTSPDHGTGKRIARAAALRTFLDGTDFAAAHRRYYQGDASWRGYETLHRANGTFAVLMNADAMPDKTAPAARKAYMQATHLVPYADVAPVLAVAGELERRGVSVPRTLAADVAASAIVMEHLGTDYVQVGGVPVPERYRAATDLLVRLHAEAWPQTFHGPAGAAWAVPRYARRALEAEAALLIDKFLPALDGKPASEDARAAFAAAWEKPFSHLEKAPRTLTLFDYHSPNLHWLADRVGLARVGVIDTQDGRFGHAAYDVVSLLQDARVTVPAALEAELLGRYLEARRASGLAFDETDFAAAYAVCGAQRATRILGVFARLATDDGKTGYLAHIPRVSAYLERNLSHPLLSAVREWYASHAPAAVREAFAARTA